MQIKDRLLLSIAPVLAAGVIRFLYWSVRTEIIGREHPQRFWDKRESMVFSFWHDQLLLMPMAYSGPGAQILISSSKDGELIARTIKYLGYDAVRGSSSRGGRSAFRELLNLSRQPVDIVVTPDGPRGPRHQIKDGILQLARLGGRAIVPVAFVCSKGHRFSSWDRFLLPYPFGRGVFVYGEPVFYDQQEGADAFRQRLTEAMFSTQQTAKERLKTYGVSPV
jgi:lysophospholipid acyltransferase (LPLAT)-like uncharacterized protein